jgi:glycosyltransferase involved in cell wall biosynthesis
MGAKAEAMTLDPAAPTAETGKSMPARKRHVLMIGEGLPLAMDRRTLRQAQTLRDAGFSLTVIAPLGETDARTPPDRQGIRLIGYPMTLSAPNEAETRRAARREAQRLARVVCGEILRGPGYALVSLARPADTGLLAARIVRFLRKPLIVDYRLPGPEALLERGGIADGPAYHAELRRERLLFAHADMVLCPSAAVQQLVVGRGGIARERAALLYDLPEAASGQAQRRSADWRKGRAHLAVFAGPLTRYAGVDLFVRAARRIVYGLELTNIQFVIAGNGPHRRAIEDLVHAEGLKDYVTCVAGEDPALVSGLLAAADVAVDPLPASPLGRQMASPVLADYVLCGVPAVAFDRGEAHDYPADAVHLVREADIPGLALSILQTIEAKPAPARGGLRPSTLPQRTGDVGPVYTALVQRLIASRVPAANAETVAAL